MAVPSGRIRVLQDRPFAPDGRYVLYWMTAHRRLSWNFALDRAVELAVEFRRPLMVFEAVRTNYTWASARFHRFVLDGMCEHREAAKALPIVYLPYVEPYSGHGKGLLEALARQAVVVIADDYPCFFLPRMVAAAASRVGVRVEAVDSNGLVPLAASQGREFLTAFAFRRFLQGELPKHLEVFPRAQPLEGLKLPRLERLPEELERRWMEGMWLEGSREAILARLPIDHSVKPVGAFPGGEGAARRRLREFLTRKLLSYPEVRNQPGSDGTSGLSPYFHFGHLSIHEVLSELASREGWIPGQVGGGRRGSRTGWWGMSPAAEAFLDQAVTWRELGFHYCRARPHDYDRYASLPSWARETLERHAGEREPGRYSLERLLAAESEDPLWNAAQRQLLEEGRIHNYLRMVWGKRLLEWGGTPQEALDWAIELNNRFALDGRDPNSYSGIFWCFGRFDRPWGPARPIVGTVRYLSSRRTAEKFDLRPYLARYGDRSGQLTLTTSRGARE